MRCDLAETYNIYDYESLPVKRVALFSYGLREDSRIKMKMKNQKYSFETILLASAVDRLGLLVWSKSEDARKGRNQPKSVLDILNGVTDYGFNSKEDFEKARKEIIERGNN